MKTENLDSSHVSAKIGLLAGAAIAFTMPFWITLIGVFLKYRNINPEKIGQIGDAFGGSMTPILNFAGLVMVYYSFRQQYIANELQNRARTNESQLKHLDSLFQSIKDEINSMKHIVNTRENSKTTPTDFYGIDSLRSFSYYLRNNHLEKDPDKLITIDDTVIEKLNQETHFILTLLDLFMKTVIANPTNENKLFAMAMRRFYVLKLQKSYKNIIAYSMNRKHDDFPVVEDKFVSSFNKIEAFFSQLKDEENKSGYGIG